MKWKQVGKLWVLLCLVLAIVGSVSSNVSANTDPYILLDSDRGVSSLVYDVNKYSKSMYKFELLTIGDDPKKVHIRKEDYGVLKTAEKRDLMSVALNLTKDSSLGGRDKSRFYNFVEEQDEGTAMVVRQLSSNVSTDVVTATSILRPFTSPFSIFLGVMSVLTFVLLSLTVTLDLLFLSIPMIQAFVIRNDMVRPKYISQEAWDAMLYSESNLGGGESASFWGVYFKNKAKTMILVGLALAYLIGGQVFDLVVFVVDVFSNVFR